MKPENLKGCWEFHHPVQGLIQYFMRIIIIIVIIASRINGSMEVVIQSWRSIKCELSLRVLCYRQFNTEMHRAEVASNENGNSRLNSGLW